MFGLCSSLCLLVFARRPVQDVRDLRRQRPGTGQPPPCQRQTLSVPECLI